MIGWYLAASLLFNALGTTSAVGFAPGIYCGYENCYDVLGINRDEFDKSTLAKTYRKLVRQYHPDRIRDKSLLEEAENKFRLITTAYETLKDDETRGYYDYYLDHPEERYYNYYQYYRMLTAPKVDIRYVILAIVLIISIIQYASANEKYSSALSYAVTQPKFRIIALATAKSENLLEFDARTGKPKKKQKNGADPETVINSIIEKNINVSGGYKKPSLKDTLAFNIVVFPYTLFTWLRLQGVIWYKQMTKADLTDDEKHYLIRKNMGLSVDQFEALDEAEREEYHDLELWISEKSAEYKKKLEAEEKEKMMNSARYKQYKRFMRRNAGSTISFLDD